MNKLHVSCVAVAVAAMALCASARATPLTLVGGAAIPDNLGYVPSTPWPAQPFTASQMAAMTDGNLSTGFTFSSSQGQYSTEPDSVTGFGLRFDFDISQFTQVSSLNFTWTGVLTWTGLSDPSVRVGSDVYDPQVYLNFNLSPSAPYTSGGGVQTGTVNYDDTSTNFRYELASVVNGNVASIWVATDLGFTESGVGATANDVALTTYEVSADATGTLAPVPLPGSLSLLLSGLMAAGLGYLTLRPREPSAGWA